MSDFKPKVTVVILTYNAKTTLGDILDKAISSALDQDYENIEVIVVDNGSSDNTYDHLKLKYGAKIKVIKFPRNYGYCLGNNLALRYVSSNTKYVLFQNPDAILSRNYIRKLIKILENNANAVATQGLEIQPINKWIRVGGSLNIAGYSVDIMSQSSSGVQQCFEILFAFGAALLIRKDVFEMVGGFSSDYFLYYDEADLGLRLRALGFKILGCTHTSYIHYVQATVSRLRNFNPVIIYFINRNRLLTILKYFYGSYLIKALILNILIMSLHFIKSSTKKRIIMQIALNILKSIKNIIKIRKIYVPLLRKRKILEKFIKIEFK